MPERTYFVSLTEGQLKALVDSQPFVYNQLNRAQQEFVQSRAPHDWMDAWNVILEELSQAFADHIDMGAGR